MDTKLSTPVVYAGGQNLGIYQPFRPDFSIIEMSGDEIVIWKTGQDGAKQHFRTIKFSELIEVRAMEPTLVFVVADGEIFVSMFPQQKASIIRAILYGSYYTSWVHNRPIAVKNYRTWLAALKERGIDVSIADVPMPPASRVVKLVVASTAGFLLFLATVITLLIYV